jgi:predicted RNase H-like nuclease (RuvC/YqgF family)
MAPVKAGIPPVEAENISDKAEMTPVKAEIISVKTEMAPVEAEIIPVKTEITPVESKLEDFNRKHTSKAKNKTEIKNFKKQS